jgi:hypothetical protein
MATLWMFTWTEYERGWGCRPDGCSLHASKEDALQFVKDYWERERKNNKSGKTPDEYSRQDQDAPIEIIIDARNKFYKQVMEAKKKRRKGIFLWQSDYRELRDKMDKRPRVGR